MIGRRAQVWCALAGPGAILVALVGWLVAGILPVLPDGDARGPGAVDHPGSAR